MVVVLEQPKTQEHGDDSQKHTEMAANSPSPNPDDIFQLHTVPTAQSTLTKGVSLPDGEKSSTTLRRPRTLIGLSPNAPLVEDHDYHDHQKLWWSRVRIALREPFAEFWGVVILVLFGDGSIAQVLLSTGQTAAPGGSAFGAYQSISWGQVDFQIHSIQRS